MADNGPKACEAVVVDLKLKPGVMLEMQPLGNSKSFEESYAEVLRRIPDSHAIVYYIHPKCSRDDTSYVIKHGLMDSGKDIEAVRNLDALKAAIGKARGQNRSVAILEQTPRLTHEAVDWSTLELNSTDLIYRWGGSGFVHEIMMHKAIQRLIVEGQAPSLNPDFRFRINPYSSPFFTPKTESDLGEKQDELCSEYVRKLVNTIKTELESATGVVLIKGGGTKGQAILVLHQSFSEEMMFDLIRNSLRVGCLKYESILSVEAAESDSEKRIDRHPFRPWIDRREREMVNRLIFFFDGQPNALYPKGRKKQAVKSAQKSKPIDFERLQEEWITRVRVSGNHVLEIVKASEDETSRKVATVVNALLTADPKRFVIDLLTSSDEDQIGYGLVLLKSHPHFLSLEEATPHLGMAQAYARHNLFIKNGLEAISRQDR